MNVNRRASLTLVNRLFTEYRSTSHAGATVRSTQTRNSHDGSEQRYAREMSNGCARCSSTTSDEAAAVRTLLVAASALVVQQRHFLMTTDGQTA